MFMKRILERTKSSEIDRRGCCAYAVVATMWLAVGEVPMGVCRII